ncbi:hypothetical protein GCM10009837_80310 [Streptomyces durmitorensis]|uniref:DUF1616 domain-containing protein n=1 Tax=Streptomyces durmitorensis TaxID=319947 RepID=A0ABY4Q2P3_9ACTN|nr:DUF1616 domain-containing protein [Streptomyces durmitorensis]UQT59508.1 DUF1616 domain-containing protein [Streptomyces durmitorensis]
MQTIGIKAPSSDTGQGPEDPSSRREDALLLLAGMAVAVGAVGAMLALTDIESPLRAPFTLFFLLAAPGSAIGAALKGLEPWGRIIASVSGAVAVNLLVAQAMLALHMWSVRGGVAALTVIGSLIYLLVLVRRLRSRTPTRRTS